MLEQSDSGEKKCTFCGTTVSKEAISCPICGKGVFEAPRPEVYSIDFSPDHEKENRTMSLFKSVLGFLRGASDRPTMAEQALEISLYIFDSNKIDESGSGMYGAYAEGRFLEALHRVVQPLGGWKSLASLMGCHGNLLNKDVSTKPAGTTVLAEWVNLKSGVSIRLASHFLDKLTVDPTNVGCIPYAIGVWPVSESMAISINNALLLSGVIGYLGNFSVEANACLSLVNTPLSYIYGAGISGSDAIFAAIASALGLPVNIGIRTSGKCFGWLVSEMQIRKFGLSALEQTPTQTQTTQKIAEARRALKDGDIRHAISLFEELVKLTSNEYERNKYSEMVEDLRKIV
jgi:hypothetical protein